MNVTTTEARPCEIAVTIAIEPAQEQELLKKAAKRIASQVNIPGYRKGKAPYNTIVRRFGAEAVQTEVVEKSVQGLIEKALHQIDLTPYAQISLDNISWGPLTITVTVPTEPVVELSDYRNISVDIAPIEVTDDDINAVLTDLQERHAVWTPVERSAQLGDVISMLVVEKHGEQILKDERSVDYELTEAEANADDTVTRTVTTALTGLSAGESKSFDVTYPENFEADYAGKTITFEVNVTAVKEKELDPLDDDFAATVSDHETLDELKASIIDNIRASREHQQEQEIGMKALEQVIEKAVKIEWPSVVEENAIDQEISGYAGQVKQATGLPLPDFLKMQNKTLDSLREEIRAQIQQSLKRSFTMRRIAELENIPVNEMDILARAKSFADMVGGGNELWQQLLTSSEQRNRIATEVLLDKAVAWLAKVAKGETPWNQADATTSEDGSTAVEDAEVSEATASVETEDSTGEDKSITVEDAEVSETAASVETEDSTESEGADDPKPDDKPATTNG